MARVGILMGSDSDLPVMQKAAQMLEKFGVEYEMTIISAHRMPDVFVDYATKAEERGIQVIIAGAGGAAHLPGMSAPAQRSVQVGSVSLNIQIVNSLPQHDGKMIKFHIFPLNRKSQALHGCSNVVHIAVRIHIDPILPAPNLNPAAHTHQHHVLFQRREFPQVGRQ